MRRTLCWLCVLLPVMVGCAQRQPKMSDFKRFTSAAGHFSVDFPGEPVEKVRTIPSAVGGLEVHSFILQTGISEYAASFTDLPASIPESRRKHFNVERALAAGRDGVAQATHTRLVSECEIKLGKWPGREWQLEATGAANEDFRWRCYMIDARQYQISVGWLKGHEPPEEILNQFLNSMTINAE